MVQKYLQRDKWRKELCMHCDVTYVQKRQSLQCNDMILFASFDDGVQSCRCLYHIGFLDESAESIGWTQFLICGTLLKLLIYNINYLKTSDIQLFWPKVTICLGEDIGMLTASFSTPLKKLQLVFVSIMKAPIECDSISVPCHCFFNASLVQTCFLWSCSWCKHRRSRFFVFCFLLWMVHFYTTAHILNNDPPILQIWCQPSHTGNTIARPNNDMYKHSHVIFLGERSKDGRHCPGIVTIK